MAKNGELYSFKKEEFVDALMGVMRNDLMEELPEEGFEDMLAYHAYNIMRKSVRHINIAMVLAKKGKSSDT